MKDSCCCQCFDLSTGGDNDLYSWTEFKSPWQNWNQLILVNFDLLLCKYHLLVIEEILNWKLS